MKSLHLLALASIFTFSAGVHASGRCSLNASQFSNFKKTNERNFEFDANVVASPNINNRMIIEDLSAPSPARSGSVIGSPLTSPTPREASGTSGATAASCAWIASSPES